MRKILFTLALILGLSGSASAQGTPIFNPGGPIVNGAGQPVTFASILVCAGTTVPAKGALCTGSLPLASIYSDIALTQPLGNPTLTDTIGNVGPFYASPGLYVISVSGTGITTYSFPVNNTTSLALQVNAPQNNSATPLQIGSSWYPGTASGLCTVPAAPTVTTETIYGGTGSYSSGTTYYVKVRIGNTNGWTPPSAPTTYTPVSGSTNEMLVQLSGYTYRSGCYKFQAEVSTDGVTYYPAVAHTLAAGNISSWSLVSGAAETPNLLTITWTANPGFIPGENVVISGAALGGTHSANINGIGCILVGQQASTPVTSFCFPSPGFKVTDSSSTAQGTGTVIAGLGNDPNSHMAPGDLIVDAVPNSGSAFPNTNTAVIDGIQVALNATCNYAANTCTQGQLIVPQGTTTLTTPLIVSNQQTVMGANSANAVGKSTIHSTWADPNLATVMVMGTANGVRLENLDINAGVGNGLMLTAWGPSFSGSNNFIRNNNITTTDLTGQYSAIYIHKGAWYDLHFENNLLNGGLADVQIDSTAGSWWFFSGSRWNGANLSASGLSTNGILSVSSVTDPDRAQNQASFPNAVAGVQVSNIIYESGTGVIFDAVNLGLSLRNVVGADSSALAATPASIRLGSDVNAGAGSFGIASVLDDINILGSGSTSTAVQFIGNYFNGFPAVTISNSNIGGTNAVDMNSVSINLLCIASACNPWTGATNGKIINQVTASNIQVIGGFNGGTANTYTGMQQFLGSTIFRDFSNNANQYTQCWGPACAGDANLYTYWGNPASAPYTEIDNYSTGIQKRIFDSSGNPQFVFNFAGGSSYITAMNPSNAANGYFTVGSLFRFENGAASSGKYFQFATVPTGARTITWPDASFNVPQAVGNPTTPSVVPVLGTLDQTGVSTANSGSPQNILASTPAAGQYKVIIYADESAGCTTVTSGALTAVLGWTDGTHARVSATLTLTPGTAATGTSSYISATQYIFAASASAITVTDTYVACSVGTWTYDQHAAVERIE